VRRGIVDGCQFEIPNPRRALYLLLFDEPFADEMVNRRFDRRGSDRFAHSCFANFSKGHFGPPVLAIARLNSQLKNARDDAEVQKLVGSLATAQTALHDIDYVSDSAHRQVEVLHVLNQNRQVQEEIAAEEISRKRNRELARLAAEAEAALPDFNEPSPDLPSGF
jgi:hypothetical protein